MSSSLVRYLSCKPIKLVCPFKFCHYDTLYFSIILKVIVFCPRLEEMEHQEILIRVREIVRCNLSYAIQKKKRYLYIYLYK